jgi:hypothetical protein
VGIYSDDVEELGIERLEIDAHIEEKHFGEHERLRFVEVEQALMDDEAIVVEQVPCIYNVFGRADGGLHLFVVLAWKGEGLFKIVSAFPMSAGQVRWLERNRR